MSVVVLCTTPSGTFSDCFKQVPKTAAKSYLSVENREYSAYAKESKNCELYHLHFVRTTASAFDIASSF